MVEGCLYEGVFGRRAAEPDFSAADIDLSLAAKTPYREQHAKATIVACPRRDTALVEQTFGLPLAYTLADTDGFDRHRASGERPRLVEADHVDCRECFHGFEPPDKNPLSPHRFDAERKRRRRHHRQPFGHGRYGNRQG